MKKHLIVLLFFLIFLLSPTSKSYAHSCTPYGEQYKYFIDCRHHTDTALIKYNLGSMNTTYKNYVLSGAQKWNNTNLVIISNTDTFSQNFIHTYSDSNTSAIASFYEYYSNNSGHLIRWKIRMNQALMNKPNRTAEMNRTVMAHEFGHALGLNDLYNSTNKNVLMYGYSSGTATNPTTWDKTGVKKILNY